MKVLLTVWVLLLWPLDVRGASYFVAPGGSDAGAGTEADPWATIGHAAAVAEAGDTVEVAPGTYVESVDLTRSGSPAAPIVFHGKPGARLQPPPGLPSPEAFDFVDAADVGFVTIEGFEIEGFDETIYLRPGTHHVEIRDCDIHHNRIGVRLIGASDVILEDLLVRENSVIGVTALGGTHDVVIRDVTSRGTDDGLGCSGDGDGFGADSSTANLTFERCTSQGNSEDGFDIRTAGALIKESRSIGNTCLGMKLSRRVTVENSLIADNGGTGLRGQALSAEGSEITIKHCTIAGNPAGVLLTDSIPNPFRATVVNSVITSQGKVLEFGETVELAERGNIFSRQMPDDPWDYDHIVRKAGTIQVATYNAERINDGTWALESGQGEGTRAGEPGFVDPATGDYHLLPNGLAVDFGLAADGTTVDLEGNPRPRGQSVDAGAYEHEAISGQEIHVTARIESRPDDAVEGRDGRVNPYNSRGNMGKQQNVGLRFVPLAVPPGALVTKAVARFFATKNATREVAIRYAAEAADHGAPFRRESYDVTSRPLTSATLADYPPSWTLRSYNDSPDLAAIVSEVIGRPGWRKGNALVLFVLDNASTKRRQFSMVDRRESEAAQLEIWFTAP